MTTPATDHLRNLLSAVEAEQAGPADISQWESLVGTWHFVGSAAMTLPSDTTGYGSGQVLHYGVEFRITTNVIRNSLNRHNQSPLAEALADDDEQIRRFGEIRFRRGPWPENALRTKPGDADHERDAQDLRLAAAGIADPDKRAAELRRIRELYGRDAYFSSGSKSRTTARYDGGSGREQLMSTPQENPYG